MRSFPCRQKPITWIRHPLHSTDGTLSSSPRWPCCSVYWRPIFQHAWLHASTPFARYDSANGRNSTALIQRFEGEGGNGVLTCLAAFVCYRRGLVGASLPEL